ncbi:MAG: hypothetical protein NT004_09100 [Bacteroidetes bacterium]|nr:hypothetical protein [Bacteroidota bacterium]
MAFVITVRIHAREEGIPMDAGWAISIAKVMDKEIAAEVETVIKTGKNQKFEDHLNTCKACRELVFNFQSVSSSGDAKRADEPNPFIQTRTIQKIESEFERGNMPHFAFSKRILQPLMLSTIILTAVVIGLALGKQVDSEFSSNLSRQNGIQVMKSDLYITDFTHEDNALRKVVITIL